MSSVVKSHLGILSQACIFKMVSSLQVNSSPIRIFLCEYFAKVLQWKAQKEVKSGNMHVTILHF